MSYNMNIIEPLEFELVYNDSADDHFNNCITRPITK